MKFKCIDATGTERIVEEGRYVISVDGLESRILKFDDKRGLITSVRREGTIDKIILNKPSELIVMNEDYKLGDIDVSNFIKLAKDLGFVLLKSQSHTIHLVRITKEFGSTCSIELNGDIIENKLWYQFKHYYNLLSSDDSSIIMVTSVSNIYGNSTSESLVKLYRSFMEVVNKLYLNK